MAKSTQILIFGFGFLGIYAKKRIMAGTHCWKNNTKKIDKLQKQLMHTWGTTKLRFWKIMIQKVFIQFIPLNYLNIYDIRIRMTTVNELIN